MADFIFRKYKHEDKEQVLNLLGSALWHFPYEERLAYFNWKYEQNPYTEAPLGFVCMDGDKVIAFRGYMLQPISIKDRVYYNAALADTVTDSSYRRMGLFSRITKFSIEELEKDASIIASTNSSSGGPTLNGYLKLGWQPLAERKHLFSFSWRSLFPKKEISTEHSIYEGKYRVCMSTDCRAMEMGLLAQNKISKQYFSVHADEEYTKWRLSNPHSDFLFFYYYENDRLCAYAVVKQIGNRKYDVVDFQFEEEKQLSRLITSMHRWLHPLFILHWTINENAVINKSPRKFNFISLQFLLKRIAKFNVPPFLIRTVKSQQQEQDWIVEGVDMRDNLNWDLHKIVADEI